MSKHNHPPTYTQSEAELEPPGYGTTLPASFRIGTTDTAPVVSVEEVQAHLKILGAFGRLKTRVTLAQETVSKDRLEPEAAWTVFLCRAVHRFEKWIQSRPTGGRWPGPWVIIPLDVLMVWHSFMLNPLSYEGDGLRTLPQLQHLDMFPLLEVAALLNSDTLDFEPTDEARQVFERATGSDFDPPLVTTANDSLEISCPACEKPISFSWPWITDKFTGWAQRSFNCHCPTCNQSIDHEAYGVMRFADDVAKWCDHARTSTANSYNAFKVESFDLAGATSAMQKMQMNSFCQQILKPIFTSEEAPTGLELAKSWKFKFDDTETELLKAYVLRPGYQQYDVILYRLRRILAHYRHPGPFSVELTSAVMRQGSFIQKMIGLGWTDPNRFATDKTVVLRAIGRYHAFLDLMSSSPASFFVPTLDIDIAWHTHQLKGRNYRADTLLMLGRTPNHDDKVEENKLSNAFDLTSQAWKRRFGVPYSVCGCAIPAEVVIPSTPSTSRTSRMSRISRTIRGVKAFIPGSSHKRSASLPPPPPSSSNSRPDLVTFRDDGSPDATHPSDHNAIIVMGSWRTDHERQRRQDRHSALIERRAREVQAGTADPWTELQHRRAQREKEKHDAAFLYPIPYWGVAPYPYGYYGYGGAACGSGGGGAVPGDGGHGGATAGACSTAGCSSNGATGGSACGSACAAAGGSSGSSGGDSGAAGGGGSSSSGGGDSGGSGGGDGGGGGGGCGGCGGCGG